MEAVIGIDKERGFPPDYLLARLSVRKSKLFSPEQESVLSGYSPSDIQELYFREYRWVFLQLDAHMQKVFLPFFVYLELKTLITCVRFRHAEKGAQVLENLFLRSLIAKPLKKRIRKVKTVSALTSVIIAAVLDNPKTGQTVERDYRKSGMRALEKSLVEQFLLQIMKQKQAPVIREFFKIAIDNRNRTALFEHLRWGISTDPVFLDGGTLKPSVLYRFFYEEGPAAMVPLFKASGDVFRKNPDARGFEQAQFAETERSIKKLCGKFPDRGAILDYLWRCYVVFGDLAIVKYGKEIHRDLMYFTG